MNTNFQSRLKAIASEVSGSSPLCVGRTKLTTEQVCSFKELTIRDFDFIKYHDKHDDKDVSYPVIIFDEIDDGFYCGGMAMNDLFVQINADPELADELRQTGLKVAFNSTKTRDGNNYTNFTVL
jgi:hypothetical protein